jgi:thiol-disulfide isomerase/thioredoxin
LQMVGSLFFLDKRKLPVVPYSNYKNKNIITAGGSMVRKTVFVIILAAVLVTSAAGVPLDEVAQDFFSLGFSVARETLPSINFALEDLDGVRRQLTDYRGSIVFLNFWATWCGPCRMEIPSMQVLYDRYKAEGLEIVAVNLAERKNTVAAFAAEYGMTFPVLLDSASQAGSLYGARSIPTSYILDREGNILGMFVGAREWDTPEVNALFEKLLAY